MKSQVNALLHVMSGIFSDLRSAYPSMRGLDLDFKTLTLLSRSRGLGFYTLDLPHLDSLLLEGLETGRLPLSGPLSKAVSTRTNVPKFLSGLWLRVFDNHGCLRTGVDSLAILFLRQISCLGKRIATECSDDRIKATIGEYHGIERQLRLPSVDGIPTTSISRTGQTIAILASLLPTLIPLIRSIFSRRPKAPKKD
jgi:hypothetical protein